MASCLVCFFVHLRKCAYSIAGSGELGYPSCYFPNALSAALLRCSGVAHSLGRFFALVILESSFRYRSERPSMLHAVIDRVCLALIVDVVRHLCFSPPSSLVLFLSDKLAVVFVNTFPAKYLLSRCLSKLLAADNSFSFFVSHVRATERE
jgi:hypothetical protein